MPHLRSELDAINLDTIDRPESTALVSALITALHDVDEAASADFIDASLTRACHPLYEAVFRSVLRYRRADFREVRVNGVNILEARAIDERYNATKYLCGWLENIPSGDLNGISRIYIIEANMEQDFAGYYRPHFALVTITWLTMVGPTSPIQWLFRLRHELTFYHEIGHHKHRHTLGGQVPQQEREADRYRGQIMLLAHPWLTRIGVAIVRLFRRRKRED